MDTRFDQSVEVGKGLGEEGQLNRLVLLGSDKCRESGYVLESCTCMPMVRYLEFQVQRHMHTELTTRLNGIMGVNRQSVGSG